MAQQAPLTENDVEILPEQNGKIPILVKATGKIVTVDSGMSSQQVEDIIRGHMKAAAATPPTVPQLGSPSPLSGLPNVASPTMNIQRPPQLPMPPMSMMTNRLPSSRPMTTPPGTGWPGMQAAINQPLFGSPITAGNIAPVGAAAVLGKAMLTPDAAPIPQPAPNQPPPVTDAYGPGRIMLRDEMGRLMRNRLQLEPSAPGAPKIESLPGQSQTSVPLEIRLKTLPESVRMSIKNNPERVANLLKVLGYGASGVLIEEAMRWARKP